MRYYKTGSRIIEKTNKWSWVTKLPTYMKKYPYYKLSIHPEGEAYLVQSEVAIPEAKELTIEQAQTIENEWAKERDKGNREVVLEIDENGMVVKSEFVKDVDIPPIDIASFDDPKIIARMNELHNEVSLG